MPRRWPWDFWRRGIEHGRAWDEQLSHGHVITKDRFCHHQFTSHSHVGYRHGRVFVEEFFDTAMCHVDMTVFSQVFGFLLIVMSFWGFNLYF